MKTYRDLAFIVVIIGALNWGLIGLASLNLVSSLFGAGGTIEKVVYLAVGVAGLYLAWDKWGGSKGK